MLYPVNFASYSNQSKLKPNFKASNPVSTENVQSNDIAIYSRIAKSYAITSPNFKVADARSKNIDIELTDKPTDPVISIELNNCDKIQSKPGMRMIHKIVLNDIMSGVLTILTDIDSQDSYIEPSSIKVDLKSTKTYFDSSLRLVNERFLDFDFDEYFLRTAKKLAPVAYFLNQKAGEYEGFFDDIPNGTSEEDYAKIVNDITLEDLKQYHNDLLKKSDLNVKLKMNKDFYKQNKIDINNTLELLNKKADI